MPVAEVLSYLIRKVCSNPVYPRSFPSGHAKLSNFFYHQAVFGWFSISKILIFRSDEISWISYFKVINGFSAAVLWEIFFRAFFSNWVQNNPTMLEPFVLLTSFLGLFFCLLALLLYVNGGFVSSRQLAAAFKRSQTSTTTFVLIVTPCENWA